MTAPPAETCGHRWHRPLCVAPNDRWPPHYPRTGAHNRHRCERPDNHEHDMLLRQPPQCRCRCGATIERSTT